MDDIDIDRRAALITACAGLARLQLRLMESSRDPLPRPREDRRVKALTRPSPWLDARDPNSLLSAAIDSVAFALAHMLALIDSTKPIDPQRACLIVQHIQGEGAQTWGTPTLRLARRLRYTLAPTPRDEFHGGYLAQYPLPRRRS